MKTKMQELEHAFKLVKLQEIPLLEAMKAVKYMMPLNAEKVSKFTMLETWMWDSIVLRFSKIQDSIAQNIITDFLEVLGENTQKMSFIDKLNLLERWEIIEGMYQWKDLRELRNHLSHEYSDRPDLLSDFLNQTYDAVPNLLGCLDAMIARIEKTAELV